jgi:hypothetical protein
MMNQVTNRAHNTTRLENTSWNFSLREAKDIISEPGINPQSRRAAERCASAAARQLLFGIRLASGRSAAC